MELAPQIKDATDAVTQLPQLLDALAILLKNPASWIFFLIIIIWFIINKDFSHVFDIFERKERNRIERLDKYITSPDLADKNAVNILRDLRDAHYFKIATGIYAEKKLRASLIKLHTKTSHLVSWIEIKRALPHINIDEAGTISIKKPSKLARFEYRYNQAVGYIGIILILLAVISIIIPSKKTFLDLLIIFTMLIVATIFSLFAFSQNLPAKAANHIRKELDGPTTNGDLNTTS